MLELVALPFRIIEINLCLAMAIDTPSHAQVSHLFYLIHRGDLTVTALALNLSGSDVLRVVEVNMVRKIMDLYPFDRLSHGWVPFSRILWIKAGRII